ncbi:MAG: hypothetical protein ABWY00_03215 [Dongiaceae bacterium]
MGTDRPADADKAIKPGPAKLNTPAKEPADAATRQSREAEALRRNLQRRKSQQRARRDEGKAD